MFTFTLGELPMNFLKTIIYSALAFCICLGMGNFTTTNLAFENLVNRNIVKSTVSYLKVSTLDELNNYVANGCNNIELTTTITVTSDLRLENINFYLNPDNSNACFTLNNATLSLENCTVTSNLENSFTYDDKERPTAVDTVCVSYSFINGTGNLNLIGCEFDKIVYASNVYMITVSGTDKNLSKFNLYDTHFSNIATNGVVMRALYTNVDFGQSDLSNKCTVNKVFSQGNGSFLIAQYCSINLYAIDVTNCSYRGNGFFAVNFGGHIDLYSGMLKNNSGFPKNGGSYGSLVHLYDNTSFNMYGGEISYNSGYYAIIATGRSNLDVHIHAGTISHNYGKSGSFYTCEGSMTIEKDASIIGDVYNEGSYMKNEGSIVGYIVVDYGTETHPSIVENTGSINGTLYVKNGEFINKGEIEGTIEFSTSDEPEKTFGKITNTGTINSEITMEHGEIINNGTLRGNILINQGSITNNKDYYSDTIMNDGTFTNESTIYGKTTVNNGEFYNNKDCKGDITLAGGTFTNNEECQCTVIIQGGSFNNNKNLNGILSTISGTFNNGKDATVTGKTSVSGGSFTNYGKIDGDITKTGGHFDNLAQIFGNIKDSGGSFLNNGKITGNVNVLNNSFFTNNGTINGAVKGNITNNGTINSPDDNAWIYYAGGTILLLILFIIMVCIVAKKKKKRASFKCQNKSIYANLPIKHDDDD